MDIEFKASLGYLELKKKVKARTKEMTHRLRVFAALAKNPAPMIGDSHLTACSSSSYISRAFLWPLIAMWLTYKHPYASKMKLFKKYVHQV